MPVKPENRALYPPDWNEISKRIRFERAKNLCERCGAKNKQPHPITGSKVVLTVAHLNHDPRDNSESNLSAMCQRCHNRHDLPHRIKNRSVTVKARNRAKWIKAQGLLFNV